MWDYEQAFAVVTDCFKEESQTGGNDHAAKKWEKLEGDPVPTREDGHRQVNSLST